MHINITGIDLTELRVPSVGIWVTPNMSDLAPASTADVELLLDETGWLAPNGEVTVYDPIGDETARYAVADVTLASVIAAHAEGELTHHGEWFHATLNFEAPIDHVSIALVRD